MNNVHNRDSYINIPSSQTYRSYLEHLFVRRITEAISTFRSVFKIS
jgi:hypothetical protein